MSIVYLTHQLFLLFANLIVFVINDILEITKVILHIFTGIKQFSIIYGYMIRILLGLIRRATEESYKEHNC